MTGQELLKSFKDNGISQNAKDARFALTLDFQDFIGHMNKVELTAFYKDLDQNERKNFIWAVSVCLSPDSLIDVLKSTTILLERERLYDDFEQEFSERDQKAFERERTFEDCKKSIYKKIRSLKNEIRDLNDRVQFNLAGKEFNRKYAERLATENRKLKLKACNFDNLQSAFSLLSV